jgi:transcriptional regulator of aromatic amino acid metabolism
MKPKVKLSKSKLEKLYYKLSGDELCKRLDITHTTLYKYLKKSGIPLKGMGNRQLKSKIIITD